jgi:hypothetical protein
VGDSVFGYGNAASVNVFEEFTPPDQARQMLLKRPGVEPPRQSDNMPLCPAGVKIG